MPNEEKDEEKGKEKFIAKESREAEAPSEPEEEED